MPSPTQLSTDIDDKYAAMQQAAMQHIRKTSSQKHVNKTLISDRTMSPPTKDFILFPEDPDKGRPTCRPDAERRIAPRQLTCNDFSQLPAVDDSRIHLDDPPRKKRSLKHGGFRIATMGVNNGEKVEGLNRQTRSVPPLAPSPPPLETPELSDVEEDAFWRLCRTSPVDKTKLDAVPDKR
ncbi:MAG: hypothetical protein Q9163_002392 [Psora crenata]